MLHFMPIILFLLFIGLVATLAFYITKRMVKRRSFRTMWPLATYIALLVISFIVVSFSTFVQPTTTEDSQGEDITIVTNKTTYSGTSVGKVYSLNEALSEKSEWNYDDDQLTIAIENIEYESPGFPIIVERKETNDQLIEAITYKERSLFKEFDFTEHIDSPYTDLAENILTIVNPTHVNLNFTMFTKEFTIAQFNDEVGGFFGEDTIIGERLLYLRIPKDLELIHDHDIQYVRE